MSCTAQGKRGEPRIRTIGVEREAERVAGQTELGREMVGWRGAVLVDEKKSKYIFFFRFLTSTTGTGIAFLPSYLRDKDEAQACVQHPPTPKLTPVPVTSSGARPEVIQPRYPTSPSHTRTLTLYQRQGNHHPSIHRTGVHRRISKVCRLTTPPPLHTETHTNTDTHTHYSHSDTHHTHPPSATHDCLTHTLRRVRLSPRSTASSSSSSSLPSDELSLLPVASWGERTGQANPSVVSKYGNQANGVQETGSPGPPHGLCLGASIQHDKTYCLSYWSCCLSRSPVRLHPRRPPRLRPRQRQHRPPVQVQHRN